MKLVVFFFIYVNLRIKQVQKVNKRIRKVKEEILEREKRDEIDPILVTLRIEQCTI